MGVGERKRNTAEEKAQHTTGELQMQMQMQMHRLTGLAWPGLI